MGRLKKAQLADYGAIRQTLIDPTSKKMTFREIAEMHGTDRQEVSRYYNELLINNRIPAESVRDFLRPGRKAGSKNKPKVIHSHKDVGSGLDMLHNRCKIRNMLFEGYTIDEVIEETGFNREEVVFQNNLVTKDCTDGNLTVKHHYAVKGNWIAIEPLPPSSNVHPIKPVELQVRPLQAEATIQVPDDVIEAARAARKEVYKKQIREQLLKDEPQLRQEALDEVLKELS